MRIAKVAAKRKLLEWIYHSIVTSPSSPYKPLEAIEYYRYNGDGSNNQDGVKPGNPDAHQLVQSKNTECYHGNRQAKGKGKPFYDIYLPATEEYQCPGEAGEKKHQCES